MIKTLSGLDTRGANYIMCLPEQLMAKAQIRHKLIKLPNSFLDYPPKDRAVKDTLEYLKKRFPREIKGRV